MQIIFEIYPNIPSRITMENLCKNPNLSAHIGYKILHFLDDKSLQTFRFVNSSMQKTVDDPKFWLQKLKKKGLLKEILRQWRNLTDLVFENTTNPDLTEKLKKCLMRLNFNFNFSGEWYWFQDPPIFITSYVGDEILTRFILENVESELKKF